MKQPESPSIKDLKTGDNIIINGEVRVVGEIVKGEPKQDCEEPDYHNAYGKFFGLTKQERKYLDDKYAKLSEFSVGDKVEVLGVESDGAKSDVIGKTGTVVLIDRSTLGWKTIFVRIASHPGLGQDCFWFDPCNLKLIEEHEEKSGGTIVSITTQTSEQYSNELGKEKVIEYSGFKESDFRFFSKKQMDEDVEVAIKKEMYSFDFKARLEELVIDAVVNKLHDHHFVELLDERIRAVMKEVFCEL